MGRTGILQVYKAVAKRSRDDVVTEKGEEMRYRQLGSTGLMVSEIGVGCEWLEKKTPGEVEALLGRAYELGMNVLDCWICNPDVRSNMGDALRGMRDDWFIQGHIGSTWNGSQYVRTRDVEKVKPAFEDLLARFHTDHIDLGMIHYEDSPTAFSQIMAGGPYIDYVRELRDTKVIGHVGLSTHNPEVGLLAIESGEVDVIMFSVNPAYDMKPATEDVDDLFGDYDDVEGMDAKRLKFYRAAERAGVGITVMKAFAGGRLLDPARSPFGVALTTAQCLHYALTRPATASVLVGVNELWHLDDIAAFEQASEAQRDYASVLAGAPMHALSGLCTYCGHCAPCTVGIDIARVSKFLDLAEMQLGGDNSEVPSLVRGHYDALEHKADECIGCGACESRCPFGVGIVERMSRAAEIFA